MEFRKYLLSIAILLAVVGFFNPVMGQELPKTGAGVAAPEFERVGSAGFQFLKLPTNARLAAMGGIMSSMNNATATATMTNPAALAEVDGINVQLSQMNWIADIDYFNGAVAKSFGSLGTFGLSFIYVDYGDMMRSEFDPVFDNAGNYTFQVEQHFDMGVFSASDLAFGLSYGRGITDRLLFGASFKYVQEKIDDVSTSALGIDIGTTYFTGLKTFRISMLGRNFGPDTQFLEWDEKIAVAAAKVKMPMTFVLGGAVDIFEGGESQPLKWTVGAEFVHTNDASEKVNTGTEFSVLDLITVRSGYRFNYDEQGLTVGGGLNLHTGSMGLAIDYSYVDFGRLNSVNMFSISLGL